jgi:DNA-binding CsgD family transcriptional regulator
MNLAFDERQILQNLYATARPEEGNWNTFLHGLAASLRATSGKIGLSDGQTHHDWHFGAEIALTREAPRRLREGRVYTQDDLAPAGPPLRALRMGLPAGGAIWLALGRAGADFRATDSALLDRLGPHLQTAARTWCLLAAERARARHHAAIAGRLGCGWISLDAIGRMRDADPPARTLIAAHPALAITPDGRLEATDPANAGALRQAIEAAGEGVSTLLDLGRLQLTVAGDSSAPGATLAYLRAPPKAADLAPGQLAAALGLTRAESRLAACLADGDSLAQAAEHLGWSIETTRSTSKQIYARLGLSGQPALIRRLTTSALWLAP